MTDMPGEPQTARSESVTKEDLQPLATRAELQAAIEPLATRAELQAAIAELATKRDLEQFATKRDLELWGGALLARIEAGEHRLLDELGRLIRSAQEETRTWISALDDKYRDLPERVARLESER